MERQKCSRVIHRCPAAKATNPWPFSHANNNILSPESMLKISNRIIKGTSLPQTNIVKGFRKTWTAIWMNIFNTKRSALFNFQTFFVILLAIIVPWAHWLAFEIFPTHARQKIDICIECVGYFHFAYKCAALSVYSVIGESLPDFNPLRFIETSMKPAKHPCFHSSFVKKLVPNAKFI